MVTRPGIVADPSRALFTASDFDTTFVPGASVTVSLSAAMPPGTCRFPLTCQPVFRVKKGPNTFHFVAVRIAFDWSANGRRSRRRAPGSNASCRPNGRRHADGGAAVTGWQSIV